MCNKSESIKEIATAMNKVQEKLVAAYKDSTNPFYGSKYATLESVMDAIRRPFHEFGLSYVQSSIVLPCGTLAIETILMHVSGEWISGQYPVKCPTRVMETKDLATKEIIKKVEIKDDPQALGSATSYARRYALSAMCGVAQVDDDGESAMYRQAPVQQKRVDSLASFVPKKTF